MAIVLFILNPGSTSTKTALYRDGETCFEQTIRHTPEALASFGSLLDQLPYRLQLIEAALTRAIHENNFNVKDLTAVVGRGGLLSGIESGVYKVDPDMLSDLRQARYGEHASNLGALIADLIAQKLGLDAYIADPPSVDEMDEISRLTGLPTMHRRSVFHALNQKAVARKAAAQLGKSYQDCRFVVAHLGGGISVGAHRLGRVVDVNNALEEGPFSPERAGTLPTLQLVDLCFSGQYDRVGIHRLLNGRGGLFAYSGTTDFQSIEAQAQNRPEIQLAIDAMAYKIAKEIAAMTVALEGTPDAIVLTGGLAHSKMLIGKIKRWISQDAPVLIYPGENEMAALDDAVRRMLQGGEPCREYHREPGITDNE